MLEQEVQVMGVTDKLILLETATESSCSNCTHRCTASVVSTASKITQLAISKDGNFRDIKAGDRLVIGVEETSLLKTAVRVYLIPLASLFIFAIAGAEFSRFVNADRNVGSILGGMFGLSVACLFVRQSRNESQGIDLAVLRKLP